MKSAPATSPQQNKTVNNAPAPRPGRNASTPTVAIQETTGFFRVRNIKKSIDDDDNKPVQLMSVHKQGGNYDEKTEMISLKPNMDHSTGVTTISVGDDTFIKTSPVRELKSMFELEKQPKLVEERGERRRRKPPPQIPIHNGGAAPVSHNNQNQIHGSDNNTPVAPSRRNRTVTQDSVNDSDKQSNKAMAPPSDNNKKPRSRTTSDNYPDTPTDVHNALEILNKAVNMMETEYM